MAVAPHRFSDGTSNLYSQMDSPSGSVDPRFSSIRANGINQNHGWKIHADFVADLTHEEGLAKAGRAADLSVIDKDLAEQFDKRLAGLGVNSDDFFKFYKSGYKGFGFSKGANYVDPNDLLTAAEVFESHGITYKMAPAKYGEGRHITAYPQSIENRDKLITSLEDRLGNRLVDQNDAAYRAGLGKTGLKNHPLSRGVSGRFTTDYLDSDPNTGKVDFSLSNEAGIVPEEYKISGNINPEEINKINKVTAEMPEMAELLHGKDGYVSPYKTIEQIAEERVTRKIAPTLPYPGSTNAMGDPSTVDELNYKGSLPAINKPGVVTPATTVVPPPTAPVTAAPTPPQSAVATETYDHGAGVAKATASGEPLVESPPPKPSAPEAPVTQPSNAPISQRRLDALEEMAASGTEAEREIARKKLEELRRSGRAPRRGPGDLGTRVPIRTEPSLKGADAAAPPPTGASVTPKTPTATVTTDAPKTSPTTTTSSGAPPKTKSLLDDAAEAARNVAKGHGNARTLGIVGAATLLGVGYATTRNKKNPPRDQGTYMDESRRRLGY